MRTLILGGRGLVGSALKRKLPDAICGIQVETKEPQHIYSDITKYETLFRAFSTYRPEVVYLAASLAHVDRCEDSAGTDVINVRGALTVLRLCEMFNSKMVYFSSSYVFDGEKESPYSVADDVNPINHYGEQKVIVEREILKSDAKSLIIRTVGVYGPERTKKNFAKQVISNIFAGRKVFAPDDQYMNPILSTDLATVTIKLANKQTGIWHVAGDTCLSKFEFARKIASQFSLEFMVEPKATSEMGQKAKRPMNGCLDCSELNRVGIDVPSFDAGLVKFLASEFNG